MMLLAIKSKFDSSDNLRVLDALVGAACALFDSNKQSQVSGNNVQLLEEYELVILDYLLEQTNFKILFDEVKINHYNKESYHSALLFSLLGKLHDSKRDSTFRNFLEIIDEYLSRQRDVSLNKYVFYFPSRLQLDIDEKKRSNLLELIQKTFGVCFEKPSSECQAKIKSEKLLLLMSEREILKISSKARDFYYARQDSLRLIKSFLGLVAFAKHYGRRDFRWSISQKKNLSQYPLEDYFVCVKNNSELAFPDGYACQYIEEQITESDIFHSKGFWVIHDKMDGSHDLFRVLLQCVAEQNGSVRAMTEKCFSLYFEAVVEGDVELSFLKFWIVIETLLKIGGKRTDDNMKSILKKIIKNPILKQRVDGVYKKRNSLVHNFDVHYISQTDRNIAKSLVDSLLTSFVDPVVPFKNIDDFRKIINFSSQSKEELELTRNILDKIIDKKSTSPP
jgi:hypothetical protein